MSAKSIFNKVYKDVTKTLTFNPAWSNGTGYYDHAVDDKGIDLTNGEVAKCVDHNGRRMLFVQTRLGRVVLFDRYAPKADGTPSDGPIVLNAAQELARFDLFDRTGGLSERDANVLLGGWMAPKGNIGETLEGLAVALAQAA